MEHSDNEEEMFPWLHCNIVNQAEHVGEQPKIQIIWADKSECSLVRSDDFLCLQSCQWKQLNIEITFETC